MQVLMVSPWSVWVIAALATAGVILRPFGWPEFVWAAAGAVLLVVPGLVSLHEAWVGVGRGVDVYLFLIGMMLLAEIARAEGLFDWLAAWAAQQARGSAARLFTLIYGVGTVVTIFLSNDATAVVLTPAVAAVVRTAEMRRPLPLLFICAFIANAASFVLPISNPANLVIYGSHMPPLPVWLGQYAVASVVSVLATYAVLRWTQRDALLQPIAQDVARPALSRGGRMAAGGLVLTAAGLMAASAFDLQLGLPTFVAGVVTTAAVLLDVRSSPVTILRQISWSVLPLVAGLFVLVEALEKTGVIGMLARDLQALAARSASEAGWVAGLAIGVGSNLVNNLPAGLVAARAVEVGDLPDRVRAAVLVGVDLGPNLSVTGSLATILWLTALRREGIHVGAWSFLKLGVLVMPPALVLALAAVIGLGETTENQALGTEAAFDSIVQHDVPQAATSQDVARLAGVSRAAVSLVLNGRGARHGLSDATQLRVRLAAETLGYTPNHAARSLRRQRTNIITLMTSDPGNRYFAEVLAAAEKAAEARGYVVNIMVARSDAAEAVAIERLCGGVSDGLVVHGGSPHTGERLMRLRQRGLACVLLQDSGSVSDVACVRVDIAEGARLATRHLISLGHRRIGHITDARLSGAIVNDRLAGYREAMAAAGLDASLVVAGANSFAGGDAAMRALMSAAERPSAVFVFNDQMAIGGLHALGALGLRVPEDVAVVGFDGTDLGAFSTPELSTVDHPRQELGRLAAANVLDQIEGKPVALLEMLPVRLVVRQSCGGRLAA
eukprot:gene2060-2098_t